MVNGFPDLTQIINDLAAGPKDKNNNNIKSVLCSAAGQKHLPASILMFSKHTMFILIYVQCAYKQ